MRLRRPNFYPLVANFRCGVLYRLAFNGPLIIEVRGLSPPLLSAVHFV
ncbi:MAG: hypothetical protein QXL15_03100 [Candidatus Korarchaeota archaeon]